MLLLALVKSIDWSCWIDESLLENKFVSLSENLFIISLSLGWDEYCEIVVGLFILEWNCLSLSILKVLAAEFWQALLYLLWFIEAKSDIEKNGYNLVLESLLAPAV